MSKFDHLFPEEANQSIADAGLPDPGERRREDRHTMNLAGLCESIDPPMQRPCTLVDLSGSGAQLAFESTHDIPSTFKVHVPALNVFLECRVVWRTETLLGVEQATRSAV